ncbi:uncharacterized protein LOC124445736 [Xenia sp. Carnegie-2017]|uniref:uncharacterized protein LOC124445736 n=1 Tax=Xenia sp. Carnegie-2017 TaxID=2897299 RepID=UPI001F049931|nr:uncharacterized protein LOC124445736 [Xenia sp. Carnegie-2017]XP_046852441.1 uncharacterized protein LOC124445736 [Xenia sp. Carnegie-2017]
MNTTVIVVEPLDSSMELVRLIKNSSCEEVMELEMFKNMEKIIVQEKSQRFGEGKKYAVTDKSSNIEHYEINQDTPCQFSLRTIKEKRKLVNFDIPSRTSCICPCDMACTLRSHVTLLPGTFIGHVEQTLKWGQPYFNIYDSSGECILAMDASFTMMFFSIGRHKVTDANDLEVGSILVEYSTSEGFHSIYITFNKDLSIATKLTILGAGLMFSNAQASRV